MPWHRLRKIVLKSAAQEAAQSYNETFSRFDDAWEGFKWLLARNPEPVDALSTIANGVKYILYGSEGGPAGVPEIWVALTYTDDEVLIHDIFAIEAQETTEED